MKKTERIQLKNIDMYIALLQVLFFMGNCFVMLTTRLLCFCTEHLMESEKEVVTIL